MARKMATARRAERLGQIIFVLTLIRIFPGLSPFLPNLSPAIGSAINQGFWLTVGALSAVAVYQNWAYSKQLFLRSWPMVIPLVWFGTSILWSPYPALTLQRIVILGIMAFTAFAVAASQVRMKDLIRLLVVTSGVVLFVNAGSVLIVPELAITPGGDFLGMHSHKNVAGVVTAITFLIFLFSVPGVRDRNRRIATILLAGLAAWFLIGSNSETSMAAAFTAPLPILILMVGRRLTRTNQVVVVGVVAIALVFTVASLVVFGVSTQEIGEAAFGDTTFTGRSQIWASLIPEIRNHPLIGSAYGAFWFLDTQPNAFYATEGFLARVGQAHNGYIDLVLQVGSIGLLAGLVPLLHLAIMAIRYAHRMRKRKSRKWPSLFLLSLIVFLVAHNILESSLFRSGAPLGMVFMLCYFPLCRWTMREPSSTTRRSNSEKGTAAGSLRRTDRTSNMGIAV